MCVCVCVFGGVVVLEWSRPHICRRSTCDGWRKISSCCCPSRGDSPSLCRQCLALEEFLSGARVTPLISHQTAGSVNLSSISNTQSSQMWRAEPWVFNLDFNFYFIFPISKKKKKKTLEQKLTLSELSVWPEFIARTWQTLLTRPFSNYWSWFSRPLKKNSAATFNGFLLCLNSLQIVL